MARVLIAWELGEALGHLARCARLAQGLRAGGHTVVLALKDLRMPLARLGLEGIDCVQAPQLPARGGARATQPASYAGVLLACGFGDAPALVARLQGWQGVIALAQPDVVVADHAPGALLAAAASGVPHLAVGNGFALPPPTDPWPTIRPWSATAAAACRREEDALDRTVAGALAAIGRSASPRLRERFGPQDVLDTFAELDAFGGRSGAHYVGPLGTLPGARPLRWQGTGGHRVLAYLRPGVPGFAQLMAALSDADAEVVCAAPGLAPAQAQQWASRRMRIALGAVQLEGLLDQATLAVGYGSGAFSTQALLAGVPVLAVPRHAEQRLLAGRLEALGAGRCIDPRRAEGAWPGLLQQALRDTGLRDGAQAFAARHPDWSADASLAAALAAIERRIQLAQAPHPAGSTAAGPNGAGPCLH